MRGPTLLIAVSLLVASCSGDDVHSVSTPAPAPATSEAEEQTEVGTLEPEAPEAEENDTPNAEPPTPPIFWGSVVMLFESLEDLEDDNEGPLVLWSEIDKQPKPDTEPTAYLYSYGGHWEIRVIREVPTDVSVVTVVRSEGGCEGRVVRAMELHAYLPARYHQYDEEDEWTFHALEFRGCPRGGAFGIAGVHAVEVHSLRASDISAPASPEQVALVRESDNAEGSAPPFAEDAFRVRDFPELGFSVVSGNSGWVVRDGVVLEGNLGGTTSELFHVGPLVLFSMSSPDSGWLTSIDDFRPAPMTCVIDDPSGTPPNVRAAPRRNAPIVRPLWLSLANGAEVLVYETRGSWHRVGQDEWVHASVLRCTR